MFFNIYLNSIWCPGVLFTLLGQNQESDKQLSMSINPALESFLREVDSDTTAQMLLRHHLQWRAVIPTLKREQRIQFIVMSFFMVVLFTIIIFIALRFIISPLHKLALSLERIGRGEEVSFSEDKQHGIAGFMLQRVSRMQSELKELRWQTEVQGMENAWREMAQVLAHEIKNPLTPLRLTVDRLEESVALERVPSLETLSKMSTRMSRQIDTLDTLVQRFRSFSSQIEPQLMVVEAKELLGTVSSTFSPQLKTTIRGDGQIFVDMLLFRQILNNIYKNSLTASATHINIAIDTLIDRVEITLVDNGAGIDEQRLSTLFTPYTTYSEGGTGIGLSVIKNLIRLMGGEVYIESVEGESFTVHISLQKGVIDE